MKKMTFFSLFLALFGMIAIAGNPNPHTEMLKVNTAASSMNWVGKKVTGQHNGTIKILEGVLTNDHGKIVGGRVVIDMTSIVCLDLKDEKTNQKLVGHLKSDDFFSVEKFPTATFVLIGFEGIAGAGPEEPNFNITGKLTIKGIENTITFPARIGWSARGMTAAASLKIDRSKWDVRYGSGSFFENLGDKMIYDDIEIDFVLEAGR